MRLTGGASTFREWAALPLRLVVGYGFVAHGYAKVMNGPDRFAASLHALGVPAAHVMAWLTIGVELIGGLAVLAGASTLVIGGAGPLAFDRAARDGGRAWQSR